MPEIIKDVSQEHFGDLFGGSDVQIAQRVNFGGGSDILGDLMAPVHPKLPETPNDQPEAEKVETELNTDLTATPTDPKEEGTTPTDPKDGEPTPDIVEAGEKTKPGRPKAKEIKDASEYFADRIKAGKFVAIKETLEDGTETDFIPKTPEEFDEVLDIQVQHQVDAKLKDLDQKWYSSKSPAFQAVAKYAELTDNPADLLPFLQGIRNIESVRDVDETSIDGAERIVRARLEQRGEAEDIIEETVESLKTTDKLLATAAKYKPSILAEESRQLQQMIHQKQQEEREYNTMITNIQENAYKAIEAPTFGKKLKQDEKADIYDLIGRPSPETGGFAIYTKIDELFESGNFEKLKKIALLLAKEEAFVGYISNAAADKTAGELQKRLKAATDNRSATGDSPMEEERPTVRREQFGHQPRFGR